MVNQFYNSPSIAFWCCHNEPGEQINTLDKYLFDAVAEEDNTRIIRMASNYEEHPYEGWYWGKADDFISTPMGPLVTEFGAQALPEYSSLKKILTAKDIEKYNWEKWEYHNFQYEQTFNVAGVPKGNNIKEFIESSQKYQAELIEKAIDYYRRKKWDGITGVFQFMFIDGWESISWAVVDYFGKAKLGYYALQKAFEPIYISIDLKKERYQNGAELFVGVYIINDLHKTFRNMKIIMYLEGTEIVNIGKVNIEADSVFYLNEEYFNAKINISAGKKILEVVLVNSQEKIISRQQKEIMIFGPRN
jgi:beta-mannosidase